MSGDSLIYETIQPEEFEKHLKLKMPNARRRRRLQLHDLLPVDSHLSYCALITALFLTSDGLESCFRDFITLFEACEVEFSAHGLQAIRKEFMVIEGATSLSKGVVESLIQAAKGSEMVYIRCWQSMHEVSCWRTSLSAYLRSIDLLSVLPNTFGEFEIFDELNNWYMYMRDDDPFIFLAVEREIAIELASTYKEYVIQLPGTFAYSP